MKAGEVSILLMMVTYHHDFSPLDCQEYLESFQCWSKNKYDDHLILERFDDWCIQSGIRDVTTLALITRSEKFRNLLIFYEESEKNWTCGLHMAQVVEKYKTFDSKFAKCYNE